MFNKILLAIRSIRNIHLLLIDYLGLVKGDVVYRLWNGNSFAARAGTTDVSEIIINNADSEYPSNFFPDNSRPVIFDVGANIGETALFIYRKLRLNKPSIYAFEPNSKNYTYLLKNIKINQADGGIKPFKLALAGESRSARLNFNSDHYDGGFIEDIKNKRTTSNSEKVKTVSLMEFCKKNKIESVDLLKMDIEGSEYEVFSSSLGFIKKHVKSIFVELHNLDKVKNYNNFKKQIVKQGFVIKAEIMNRTIFLSNTSYDEKI